MKKSLIIVGKVYSNGKGSLRRVDDISTQGKYILYPNQHDTITVKYTAVSMHGKPCNVSGIMTLASFAVWAKKEKDPNEI